MLTEPGWKARELVLLIAAIIFILVLHGAIPFLMMPTLGLSVWSMGFAESFAHAHWYSLYAYDFGIPKPAAIAFGLAGVWPASILIRLGFYPADAYTMMVALYLMVAFAFAYKICVNFNVNRMAAILGSVAWLSMPIVWAHSSYSMLSLGIGLLPFYFLSPLNLLWDPKHRNKIAIGDIFLYFLATVVSVFMDGYSFMMFALGSSVLYVYAFVFRSKKRRSLLMNVLPIHVASFLLAYILFGLYIGKSGFDTHPTMFFRGFGLDLSFAAIPTKGILWIPDFLGLSLPRTDATFFGDKSVWRTTFALPIIAAGVIAWWQVRKHMKLATAVFIVAVLGFYLALGPSLKINSTKPESLAISQPGQLSALMPADLAIMPTGNALISDNLPGFNVMRAAYRWSALGIFAFWLLVIIRLAYTDKKGLIIWSGALLGIIILNLPDLPKKWQKSVDARAMFQQIDNELVAQLRLYIKNNEKVIFLPTGNDFMVNYLAPRAGFKTYNIGGDKNLADAQEKWPASILKSGVQINTNNLDAILTPLIMGNADVAVIPYFNLLSGTQNWPCESESIEGIRVAGRGWDKHFTYSSGDNQEISVPITSSSDVQSLYISVPSATSPAALAESTDTRVLGIALQAIELQSTALHNGSIPATGTAPYPISVGSGMKNRASLLYSGWYATEENHVWSGQKATINLPVPDVCHADKCEAKLKFRAYGASTAHPAEVRFTNIGNACPIPHRIKLSPVITSLKASPYLAVSDTPLFASVRLRSEFSTAAAREELLSSLISAIPYPLIFTPELKDSMFILGKGWHPLEGDLVWSTQDASIILPVPADCRGETCSAVFTFALFGASPQRPVLAKLDTLQFGKPWSSQLTATSGDNYQVTVPLNSVSGRQEVMISVPAATSPQRLGISIDGRTLGMALRRIDILRKQ